MNHPPPARAYFRRSKRRVSARELEAVTQAVESAGSNYIQSAKENGNSKKYISGILLTLTPSMERPSWVVPNCTSCTFNIEVFKKPENKQKDQLGIVELQGTHVTDLKREIDRPWPNLNNSVPWHCTRCTLPTNRWPLGAGQLGQKL